MSTSWFQTLDTCKLFDEASGFRFLIVCLRSVTGAGAGAYYGFTQEMSFARLALSTATIERLPAPASRDLPPRAVATAALQDCIQNIFVYCPVLSDTAVFGALEVAFEHGGHFSSPHDIWNLNMCLAIGFLTRSRAKDDAAYQKAVHHAAIALEQRETVVLPGALNRLQAIILLVLYSLLNPTHFDTWCLMGLAVRVMVDMGLHAESFQETHTKRANAELRHRLFNCIYILDR